LTHGKGPPGVILSLQAFERLMRLAALTLLRATSVSWKERREGGTKNGETSTVTFYYVCFAF
jgi:hypothetical protein